jgi:hypothetical protein
VNLAKYHYTTDMDSLFLSLHIAGALGLAVVAVFTFLQMYIKKLHLHFSLAKWIAYAGGFQVITGSILALISTTNTPITVFCSKMGIYITSIVILEVLIYQQMQRNKIYVFPVRAIMTTLTLSITVTGITTASLILL